MNEPYEETLKRLLAVIRYRGVNITASKDGFSFFNQTEPTLSKAKKVIDKSFIHLKNSIKNG